jgi:hypothetical protein
LSASAAAGSGGNGGHDEFGQAHDVAGEWSDLVMPVDLLAYVWGVRGVMLAAVVAVVLGACTGYVPGPPAGTTSGSSSVIGSAAPPTTPPSSPPNSIPPASVELQPGPHSAVADVDLPAGTVPLKSDSDGEYWGYSATYEDVVAFLRERFAMGRRYDSYGATYWLGLPPCYQNHQSPPRGLDGIGWVTTPPVAPGDARTWIWSDGSMMLYVSVHQQWVDQRAPILIARMFAPYINLTCDRA